MKWHDLAWRAGTGVFAGVVRPGPVQWLCFAALLLVALVLRSAFLGVESFWMDEIYGVTYTQLPFWQLIVAVLRFDIHPPFYYLQLKLWSVFGHSDVWLALNSVVWSIATVVLVYFATLRRFGCQAALAAMALCAVVGGEVFYAHELRMYSMLSTLALLSWMAADRLLADYRIRTAWPLIGLLVFMGGLHSASLIPISAALIYAAPVGPARAAARHLRTWVLICAIVGATLIPWIINASLRTVGQTSGVTLAAVLETFKSWLIGPDFLIEMLQIPLALQVGCILLLMAALIAAVLWAPASTRIVAAFIVWPLLFTALVCLVKPVWYYKIFSFSMPFICIAIGLLWNAVLQRLAGRLQRIVLTTVLTLSLATVAVGVYAANTLPRKTEYGKAADHLRQHAQPGDIVWVPEYASFWGMARYMVGPDWGSPLDIQDPVNPDRSRRWPEIYRKLGPERLKQLHLAPLTRRLDGFKVPVFVGWTELPAVRTADVIWVLFPYDSGIVAELSDIALCASGSTQRTPFNGLALYRVACPRGAAS